MNAEAVEDQQVPRLVQQVVSEEKQVGWLWPNGVPPPFQCEESTGVS